MAQFVELWHLMGLNFKVGLSIGSVCIEEKGIKIWDPNFSMRREVNILKS